LASVNYQYIYNNFITNQNINKLFYKFCNYNKQKTLYFISSYKDEVISDLGLAFIQGLEKKTNSPINYLKSVLNKRFTYSIYNQIIRENKETEKEDFYKDLYIEKINSRLIDNREEIPIIIDIEDFNFSQLNKNELKIIELFYIEGLSIKDIVLQIGLKEDTIKEYKREALKKIKYTS